MFENIARKNIRIAFFIFLLLTPLLVKADEPRHQRSFTSANGKFEFRMTPDTPYDTKWSLIEKESKTTLYEVNGQFASMTVLVGDDGKSLVAVDDYSEQDPEDNPVVLRFFRDAKPVKSYKLSELLANPKIITRSVSHFYFLLDKKDLALSGGQLSLTTFELFKFDFDTNSGEIVKKERDGRLSEGAIYAYGDISGSMNGEHQIKIQCLVFGKIPPNKTIKFTSKKYIYDGGSFHDTVLIKDGAMIARFGILLNTCETK